MIPVAGASFAGTDRHAILEVASTMSLCAAKSAGTFATMLPFDG